jgi:hypothetical protein
VDHLFDRGFISFENNGDLLISPVVHRESLKRMGIPPDEKRNVGAFTEGQRRYLEYHRDLVFFGGEGEGLGCSNRRWPCSETVDFNKNYLSASGYSAVNMRSVPLPAYN